MKRTIFLITAIIVNCPFYCFVGSFTADAHAGSLKITNYSAAFGGDNCYAYCKHRTGSNEGHDIYDSPYLNSHAQLQIYIYNAMLAEPPFNADLSIDSRGLNSITPYDVKLEADGFISYADNSLKFNVLNTDGALRVYPNNP